MLKKRVLATAVVVGLIGGVAYAKPNAEKPEMFQMILKKVGGEPGPFSKRERFPNDYMLVHDNLPYSVGITLFHPMGSEIGLSKDQLADINKIKDRTVPVVLKAAKKIKDLEIKLAKEFAMKKDAPKPEEFFKNLEEIAKQRLELSKAHLQCIQNVKDVMSKEQYEKFIKIATAKGAKKGADKKIKGDGNRELISFTHGGVMVKMFADKLGITDEQVQRFSKEILMDNAAKIHELNEQAKKIELAIKKAVEDEGKKIDEVKEKVDELAEIKKKVSYLRIKAFPKLRDILKPEQYKKGMQILKSR